MITFTAGLRAFVMALALIAVCARARQAAAVVDVATIVLKAKGHHLIEPMRQTSANSVTPDGLLGAPDPRTRGSEAAGS